MIKPPEKHVLTKSIFQCFLNIAVCLITMQLWNHRVTCNSSKTMVSWPVKNFTDIVFALLLVHICNLCNICNLFNICNLCKNKWTDHRLLPRRDLLGILPGRRHHHHHHRPRFYTPVQSGLAFHTCSSYCRPLFSWCTVVNLLQTDVNIKTTPLRSSSLYKNKQMHNF